MGPCKIREEQPTGWGDEVERDRGPTKKPGFRTFINQNDGKAPVQSPVCAPEAYTTELCTVLGVDFIYAFFLFDKKGNRL